MWLLAVALYRITINIYSFKFGGNKSEWIVACVVEKARHAYNPKKALKKADE